MNNKHLSWYEEINNNFIIASRAYFHQKPSDMSGVPRELAEHTLNIDPKFKPVKQFLRRFNKERHKAIS